MNRPTKYLRNPCPGRSLIGDQGLGPGDMEPIIAGRDLRKSWGATLSQSVIVNDPILNGLGVGEELLDQRFGSLSGGEKSKVLTARALANAKDKDVLLLDEPTNHMDVDTIETIEAFLGEIDAAVLLASHDKFLLDAIAEKVIEIDRLRTLEYVGNYTDYRVQRDALARAREAQRHRHQAELKRQLAIIEAFKSRKVHEQSLSRKLRVEQMRRETPAPPPTAPPSTGRPAAGGIRRRRRRGHGASSAASGSEGTGSTAVSAN